MLECLILGDSIANGLSQAKKECVSITRSGITSEKWYRGFGSNPFFRDDKYKVAVISLGTNDLVADSTSESLYIIRRSIDADMIIWILPSATLKPKQRQIVIEMSNEFKDKVLDIREHISYDGIHPNNLTEYRKIIDKISVISKP
jgi:hypothetical protein